jgi:uncharacterized membrane-anchored protein YhcB (DUF1043 family)
MEGSSVNAELVWILASVASGLAVGFLIGRRTGSMAARIRELEAEIEGILKEGDRVRAELRAAQEEGRRIGEEFGEYRRSVAEHFAGTSDQLRDLTLQYRRIYDHLTHGANTLCPDGFSGLRDGLDADALPPGESLEFDFDEPTRSPDTTDEASEAEPPIDPDETLVSREGR